MWQPLWRGGGVLRPGQAILVVLITALWAMFSNWWLIAAWIAALTALIGGSVPSITGRRERAASLLAATYLLALLLIWVVPQLSGQMPADSLLHSVVRYGLPLVAIAILFVRAGPSRAADTMAVDLFYSVMLFLLVMVLVLGSFALKLVTKGDYLFAVELAGTTLLIATIGAISLAPRRSQGTL